MNPNTDPIHELIKRTLTEADGANQIGDGSRVIPGTDTVQSPAVPDEEPSDEDKALAEQVAAARAEGNPVKKAAAERDATIAAIKKALAAGRSTPIVKQPERRTPVTDPLELVRKVTAAQAAARIPRRPGASR